MSTKTTPNGNYVSEFAALEGQIQNVQQDVHEIRASMTKVADALVTLARIEERHIATQQQVAGLTSALTDATKRITELEKINLVHTARFDGVVWTIRIVWTLIGAGVLALGAKLAHQLIA
jgi:prefoldin subunit 5